ncbi:winged helix-turn-helix domain-containing protein [Kiloniella sp. b19]|uniref:winged helix-turn-helix domain-containing protein n=1 Tax=Kiloniella sp. GXU_MW_B19 TaxID=3141326 RepID=UPI0031D8D459
MKEGPDISILGALIGDPARANMLIALMSGKALTASELASEAGVTRQTASAHLQKLESAQLIRKMKQGRHKYFALADDDIGSVLEALMGLAAKRGLIRTRTGPRDPALRKARICYDHLAGDLAVELYDLMLSRDFLRQEGEELVLCNDGEAFFSGLGFDLARLQTSRRPLCKGCLDWSARRNHLAGSLGAALLDHCYAQGWAKREDGSRIITFTPSGEQKLLDCFRN